MLATLLYKLSLFLFGFNLFLFTRCTFQAISVRNILRHVPGPEPSSILFGEEWELYRTTPGSRYVEWHSTFGRIVKLNGAFGVGTVLSNDDVAPSHFHQHKILSVTDLKAISYILGEGSYIFPKSRGVRAWFQALLGEGVLWVEGAHSRACAATDANSTLKERKNTNFKGVCYPRHSSKNLFDGSKSTESSSPVNNLSAY